MLVAKPRCAGAPDAPRFGVPGVFLGAGRETRRARVGPWLSYKKPRKVSVTRRATLLGMPADARRDRLLVVDDDENVRSIVVRLAVALGYEAKGESRGAGFLQAYDEFEPTIIVMDGYLGDVDLEEIVDQIASKQFRGKLIFISGAEDYLALAELHTGRVGLQCRGLLKPFGTQELEATLLSAPTNEGRTPV